MSRLVVFAAFMLGAAVFAVTRPTTGPRPVHAASTTFNFTGAPVNYPVPAGVTRVQITANGARGGSTAPCNSAGGAGGQIVAVVNVTPGSTLQVLVGSDGTATTAGFNGGGSGGNSAAANRGAGGGGSSDVRIAPFGLADRLVVAGGGGGAGGCSVATGGAGGAAGSPGIPGATGTALPGFGTSAGAGGGGATTVAGGGGPPPFGTGTAGQGGTGATSVGGPPYGDGGGGGGGYFGGGGGGASPGDTGQGGGGGGGGGSNFAIAGATVTSNGSSAAAASVTITALDPPTISKSFLPAAVQVNGVTNLTISLTNPNPAGPFSQLTGISFTDNFAAQGLVITTGAVTGTPACGGVITANAGTSVISATGITLAAGATCQITVEVRATIVGTQTNVTGAVSSTENTAGGTASAQLVISALPLTPTVTPTATATATPVVLIAPPVIPQVFQHIPQGIFTNPRPNTPTPVARAAVAPVVADPAGPIVLRPPSTGDAGLLRVLKLPSAW